MARVVPMLLVLVLLGSTAAAFAVTEGLKLEKSPIASTQVDKVVAPGCGCSHDLASITFVLRKGDRLTVAIVDANRDVVRVLARSRRARRGAQQFSWKGRDNAGRIVPDGTYEPRVHMAREHRTILLPNPIRVDATAPEIRLVSVRPRVFSPDGDLSRDFVRLRYRASEKARAILYVNGDRRTTVRGYVRIGKLDWRGRAVRGLPPGRYSIRLRAMDLAGNLSPLTPPVIVRVRYIALRPHVVHVRTGARFGFRVSTDAKRYGWRFGARGGFARRAILILRAGAPGRYRLTVTESGHSAHALVIVEPRS